MENEIFGEDGPEGRPRKIGVFEQAHGGTLFLDEVGDMPPETQSKILRVLVEQRFRRLGGSADVQVNVRVVSSASRDLRGDIEQGRFREDLFHRLNVVPLRAPSLAERRDDIPELAGYFVGRLAGMSGVPARQIGEDTLAALQAADWPGNVRQLRNVIERILILATGDAATPVTVDNLPPEAWPSASHAKREGMHEVIAMPLRDAREGARPVVRVHARVRRHAQRGVPAPIEGHARDQCSGGMAGEARCAGNPDLARQPRLDRACHRRLYHDHQPAAKRRRAVARRPVLLSAATRAGHRPSAATRPVSRPSPARRRSRCRPWRSCLPPACHSGSR